MTTMRELQENWHRQVHRVSLQAVAVDLSGHGSWTGSELMRAPGYGPYSFAIAWRQDQPIAGRPATLASQESFWNIELSATGDIQVDLDGWRHQLPAAEPADCQSLLLSGFYLRIINSWSKQSDRAYLSLWRNGKLAAADDSQRAIEASGDTLNKPLFIGQDSQGRKRFPGQLSTPWVATSRVTENSMFRPADIHETLCSQLTGKPHAKP